MEILAILGVFVVIGVVVWMVIPQVFQVANTGRDSRAWEKRFAEQEREAERERSRAELWEAIVANSDFSAAPCPFLCDDCKEDGGEGRVLSFIMDGDPADKFIHQAAFVVHGLCVLCGGPKDD